SDRRALYAIVRLIPAARHAAVTVPCSCRASRNRGFQFLPRARGGVNFANPPGCASVRVWPSGGGGARGGRAARSPDGFRAGVQCPVAARLASERSYDRVSSQGGEAAAVGA